MQNIKVQQLVEVVEGMTGKGGGRKGSDQKLKQLYANKQEQFKLNLSFEEVFLNCEEKDEIERRMATVIKVRVVSKMV